MSNTNTGGPAFAVAELANIQWEGMTLRDYFAAKAMQGHLASSNVLMDVPNSVIAIDSYRLADAMLKAREA